MSDLSKKNAGVLLVVAEEFRKHRLPRLLALRGEVENGKTLDNADIEFLDRIVDDASQTMPLTVDNPKLHEFCAHVVHLYKEVTEKALGNEKN